MELPVGPFAILGANTGDQQTAVRRELSGSIPQRCEVGQLCELAGIDGNGGGGGGGSGGGGRSGGSSSGGSSSGGNSSGSA